MIQEKISNDFRSDNVIQNIDIIKGYFEKKGAICATHENDVYQYSYNDQIRNEESTILCSFNLKEEKAQIKLTVDIDNESVEYEIDILLEKIFADLMKILMGGKERYVIRVYGRYYLINPLTAKHTFNWKNKINLIFYNIPERHKIYNIGNITTCPKEQVLFCDIEVSAYNLSAARSIAYNLFLEFTSLLSVLLDLMIEPYTSRENFLLVDTPDGYCTEFIGTFASNGIDDAELNLLVFDNMNGLVAIDEKEKMILNNYWTLSSNNGSVTQSSYNEVLEKVFKNRTFEKFRKQYEIKEINKEITYCNLLPEIVSEHCSFFRKVVYFEEENETQYNCFLNACKLYNYALQAFLQNPTVGLSYFVASIEALSKTEKTENYIKVATSDMDKFVNFCNNYYNNDDFDENFYKYLYGKIRSGHFHSGEFHFFEHNCNFDLSLNNVFLQMQNKLLRARCELRIIFINWIKRNIFKEDI